MAAIILPNRLRKQPQYAAQIDWGNPLAAGLVFCAFPLGKGFYEVISNQTTGHPGSSRARYSVDGNRELAVSHIGASAAGGQFANQTGLDRLSGAHSIFVEGSLEVNGSTQEIVKSFETGAGNGIGLRLDDVSLINNGFIYWANNGNRTSSTSGALGTNSEQFSHRIAFTNDGTNTRLYAKGLLNNTAATAVLPTANANRRTSMLGSNNTQGAGSLSIALAWNRVLSLAEYQALYDNPWQIFKAPSTQIWFPTTVSSDPTGTISWTEADDNVSLTGVVTNTGTVSWTEPEDTVSLTGSVFVVGNLSWTEPDDTVSITGSQGSVTPEAVISWVESEDTVAITGAVPVTAEISWAEVNDTFNFTAYTPAGSGASNERRRVRVGNKVVNVTSAELKKVIEQEILVQKAIAKTQNKTPKPTEVTKAVQQALQPVIEDLPVPDVLPVIRELKQKLKAVQDAPVLKAVKKIEKQLIQEQQDDDDEEVLYLLLMG
jgi:hypothetical protein